MKIIIATPLFPPEIETISSYSKDLAEHLKNNHDIAIAAYAARTEEVSGVKIFKTNKRRPLLVRLFVYTKHLFKLAKAADIIYAQGAVASGLPAIIAGRMRKVPVVINLVEDEAWKRALQLDLSDKSLENFLANPDGDLRTRQIISVQGWTLKRADKVIVASDHLQDILIKHYKVLADKIVVNYPPQDKDVVLPFAQEKNDKQMFVSGRLYEWSGMDKLIRDMVKLPETDLLIAGDGPYRKELEELARELSVADRVKFLGQISKAEQWYLRKNSISQSEFKRISWQEHLEKLNQVFDLILR